MVERDSLMPPYADAIMAGHLASVLIEKATHRQAECGTIKRPKQFLSLFLEQLQATRLVQSSKRHAATQQDEQMGGD